MIHLPSSLNLYHLDGYLLTLALFVDFIAGDPRRIPHPVVIIGMCITHLENISRRMAISRRGEYFAGMLIAFMVPSLTFVITFFILTVCTAVSHTAGWIAAVFIAYTTIAARSLYSETRRVADILSTGDIIEARRQLSFLVGRDTMDLDEREIIRALIETISENTSDGVIAPLFYLYIGGPALAMTYKAVNTLDSMVGYKNERYLYLGRASARLDDLVNWIPARLTSVLISLSAYLLRLDGKASLHMTMRDGRNHSSPNSGYPEAAAAGALGIRLGGPSSYGGIHVDKPYIGDPLSELDFEKVRKAGRLMITSSLIMVAILLLITIMAGI